MAPASSGRTILATSSRPGITPQTVPNPFSNVAIERRNIC